MTGTAKSGLVALAAAVPAGVVQVCRVLAGAGHQAVTVGGGVRDTLLGRRAGDWDVATSAHPDQVQALFDKVLPTGIDHGTVTVILGKGKARESVEVTSYRGEGAYSDARRPDQVRFGVPLTEDLARRDFVINAIAYDPVTGSFFDPFGGLADLDGRVIRAVGVAAERFAEDGLRIMRAIRFAAVLEFELDADTEAAIPAAIPSLAKVSRERVHDELLKLLRAPRPSRGLEVAVRTGVIASILPELAERPDAEWTKVFARIDAVTDPVVRAALLFVDPGTDTADDGDPACAEVADGACRRLKFSNHDRQRITRMVRWGRPGTWLGLNQVELRQRMSAVGRVGLGDIEALLAGCSHEPGVAAAAAQLVSVIDRGDAVEISELAVAGRDLLGQIGARPGPHIGEVLRQLLDEVLADPAANRREHLLDRARALLAEPPRP